MSEKNNLDLFDEFFNEYFYQNINSEEVKNLDYMDNLLNLNENLENKLTNDIYNEYSKINSGSLSNVLEKNINIEFEKYLNELFKLNLNIVKKKFDNEVFEKSEKNIDLFKNFYFESFIDNFNKRLNNDLINSIKKEVFNDITNSVNIKEKNVLNEKFINDTIENEIINFFTFYK